MSRLVKSVELTFENLDWIEIPAEYFGSFSISGIRTSVERLTCNAILQRSKADHIEFELLRYVDIALSELNHDICYDHLSEFSLLDRIRERRDITSLGLHYQDGTTEQFSIPWEDAENETQNKSLYTQRNSNSLLVTIGACNENLVR